MSDYYHGFRAGASTAGNTAGTTGTVLNQLLLVGGANITLSESRIGAGMGTLTIIGGAGGGGGSVNFSAGTTSQNLTNVVFSNSNNVSFGLNGSTITATATFAAGGDAIRGIAAGGSTASTSTVNFSNANGVSFGFGAGANSTVITASHNALTSQSNQALSGSNGSFTFQTATFGSSNGLHFYTTNGSMVGSYTVPTVTNSVWTVSDAATSGTVARLAFTNLNGVTLSLSTGAAGSHTIVGSHNGLTSQSNQALSAPNGSFTFQTAQFHNSHGISWSTTTGSGIIASHNGITSQSNQQMTLFATGNTTLSSTGTTNASSIVFRGSGAASVGITNGSVLIDVAAGAAAITQSIGISTETAGGATAGTSGYATGDDILYHFVPGSNITMSQSLNGASATLSIYGAGGGAGFTHSQYDPYWDGTYNLIAISQASLMLDPLQVPSFQHDRVGLRIFWSNASNSTGSMTVSNWFAVYTRNDSSLSLVSSTSTSNAITFSGTVGNHSLQAGHRLLTIPWTNTLGASDYCFGVLCRTTTGGANGSFSQLKIANAGDHFSGIFGQASNATRQRNLGKGIYSASTTGIPGSIAFSEILGSQQSAQRMPMFAFFSGTA